MKLVCVKDTEDKTDGFFNKTTTVIKTDGLTIGKTYIGQAACVANTGGAGLLAGSIDPEDWGFMIFDDNKEWTIYAAYCFAPAESK